MIVVFVVGLLFLFRERNLSHSDWPLSRDTIQPTAVHFSMSDYIYGAEAPSNIDHFLQLLTWHKN